MQSGATVVAVPAAARLEITTSCTKCLFDAYYGQFDVEECKGQIPSHIANTQWVILKFGAITENFLWNFLFPIRLST